MLIDRFFLARGAVLTAFICLVTAACSERTTPAAAPEATNDPAVETSRPQSQQTTPQGEAPAQSPPRP
jgi:hypothetical protein